MIFDEFPNVIASVSGGKDSTVIFHLCLQVAREKGRLPLTVFWLDQEAEWQATVDQVTEWMTHPDVRPLWCQFPFKLFNATSTEDHWLHCWDPAVQDRWVHPQVDISLKENVYGTDRFHDLFAPILRHEFPGKSCCIAGVRTEESPTRHMGMTYYPKYKWITWGKRFDAKHYTFYPLYDWAYTDVWKSILDNQWSYNKLYDALYRYGTQVMDMRVSNVHHETAVRSLFFLQEVEPETYERLVQRIHGIDMAGKMGHDQYFVHALPLMFSSWREYRDYLLEHLIDNPVWRQHFHVWFTKFDEMGVDLSVKEWCGMVNAILCNDWEGVKLEQAYRRPELYHARKQRANVTG